MYEVVLSPSQAYVAVDHRAAGRGSPADDQVHLC